MFLLNAACCPSALSKGPALASLRRSNLGSKENWRGACATSLPPSSTTETTKLEPTATSAWGWLKYTRPAPGAGAAGDVVVVAAGDTPPVGGGAIPGGRGGAVAGGRVVAG